MRVFFALWPDDDTREALASRAAELQLDAAARRVPPSKYHLTLAFLGEIDPSDLDRVRRIADTARAPACSVGFDCCEHWRSSRAIVASARRTPPPLTDLSAWLYREFALTFPGDARFAAPLPLRAHVTLARKVMQAPVLQEMSPFDWRAKAFALVRSDAGIAHAIYTVVDTWPLLYASPSP